MTVKRGDFTAAQQQIEEEVRVRDIDLSQVFGLNSMKKIQVSGKYIVIFPLSFSLTDPDQVTLGSNLLQPGSCFARVGSNTKVPVALVPGTAYEFDEFSELWIINTVAQPNKMLRLYISTNPIVKIAAPPQQISGAIQVTENQTVQGVRFFDLTLGALGVTQIIAPATNVNGVKIRDGFLTVAANAGVLYADTAAPASTSDATKKTFLPNQQANSTLLLPYPKTLSAGIGLWIAAAGAGVRAAGTYDVL